MQIFSLLSEVIEAICESGLGQHQHREYVLKVQLKLLKMILLIISVITATPGPNTQPRCSHGASVSILEDKADDEKKSHS